MVPRAAQERGHSSRATQSYFQKNHLDFLWAQKRGQLVFTRLSPLGDLWGSNPRPSEPQSDALTN